MIICLGPLCIPLWGVLPFLLGIFTWVKNYLFGEEKTTALTKDKNIIDHTNELPIKKLENSLVTNGEVLLLSKEDQLASLIESTKSDGHSLFVKFTSTYCGPCKAIAPFYKSHASNNKNHLFIEVNCDNFVNAAQECGVSAMPTFQVYKLGRLEGEVTGANKAKLQELVEVHSA